MKEDQRTEVQCVRLCQVSNELNDLAMISSAEGVEIAKPLGFPDVTMMHSLLRPLIYHAIINDTEPPVTGFDGLQPVKIALQLQNL